MIITIMEIKKMDNIKILKEVLENMDETDRYNLFLMFRMLIKKVKIKVKTKKITSLAK